MFVDIGMIRYWYRYGTDKSENALYRYRYIYNLHLFNLQIGLFTFFSAYALSNNRNMTTIHRSIGMCASINGSCLCTAFIHSGYSLFNSIESVFLVNYEMWLCIEIWRMVSAYHSMHAFRCYA